ncbi:LuxR C-terminal-related transcriptional regulator [Nocardia sp. CNY236]|uniref:helix-turn-helix transcriptional regulator n=1 Tax=Nocardia sp. CNY236 TaxID=1169152 RepID=UPI00048E1F1F|nr:LuxR C-terminal-related transcriptional regulator [Nocardia sp. CNY236]
MTTSHIAVLGRGAAAAERGDAVPLLPFAPIARADLHAGLDAVSSSGNGHVLLLCAPAGTGKTVLLADWARRAVGEHDIAWLTVTEELDDAAMLWATLHARFGVVSAGRPGSPLAEAAVLAETLAAQTTPTVLVIDDAHLITDPFALAGVEYFLQHAPRSVTTVVCARVAPPIRWHVLELQARLTRWGTQELTLAPEQIDMLCRAHGCELTDSELETINSLTDGWAALVRIGAAHIAGAPDDRTAALSGLARPVPAVAEFLVSELIEVLQPALRQFLTYTSVAVSFTEQLADELVGGGAGHCLRELDRINFPINSTVRDEQVWFTCHPMVRAYFVAEARRLGPQLCVELHAQSARWLCSVGLPATALPHLLAVPDREQLYAFLSEFALRMVLDGDGEVLFGELARSAPTLLDDPFLWLVRVVDALGHGSVRAARACLDTATVRRASKTSVVSAEVVEALAWAAMIDLGANCGDMVGESPQEFAPIGNPDIDAYVAIQVATAQVAAGAVAQGEQLLRASLALAEHACRPRLVLRALTRLAFAAEVVDAASAMRARAAHAVAFADGHGLVDSTDAVQATAIAAYGAYLHGEPLDPGPVHTALSERVDHDGSWDPAAGWHGYAVGRLLDLECAEQQSPAADALRRSLLALVEHRALSVATSGLILSAVWALARVHDAAMAQLIVDRSRDVVGDSPEVRLVGAAVAAASDRPRALGVILEPILDDLSGMRPSCAITGWLLYAWFQHDSGVPTKALAALERALGAAAPHRLVRPFLDVPAAVGLLDCYSGRFGRAEGFAELVRRHPAIERPATYPTLTRTEMTVLKQLPSGRTAQQIAADLGVSVNTVKTHLRGIYAKLGSNSRVDVLDRARRGGLL